MPATSARSKTDRSKTECHCFKLRMAARRVTQVYDQELAETGLTITQFALLGHVRRLDGIAVGALAETLLLDATALMRSLKPLEQRGFIATVVDPRDKRARRVHITATGLAAQAAARPAWRRAQARITKALGPDDDTGFALGIDRLLDRLAE